MRTDAPRKISWEKPRVPRAVFEVLVFSGPVQEAFWFSALVLRWFSTEGAGRREVVSEYIYSGMRDRELRRPRVCRSAEKAFERQDGVGQQLPDGHAFDNSLL